MRRGLIVALLFAAPALAAQTRIASDFELAQMEAQVARSRDFLSQLSGHLNLGDLRLTRNEVSLARGEYRKALDVASRERLEARRASDLARYATATAYAGLAEAKLGGGARSFAFLEEAMRYAADDAKTWNLYATAMSILRQPRKAASAARNAVAIAEQGGDALDLAVYQYSLASALIESSETAEAERLLVRITESLRSPAFDSLRRAVARKESFEIYSTARGDEAAYISLLNRAQLRLAALYESRGDAARAREQYERVLAARSDDATALAGLARLAQGEEERQRYFAEAFDANPFSPALIREYRRYAANHRIAPGERDTTGSRVRLAIEQMARGESHAAHATVDALLRQFPQNDSLTALRRELEEEAAAPAALPSSTPSAAELRRLMARFDRLTPEERVALDKMTFVSRAVFDGTSGSVFESGTIEGVPFRFSEPTQFAGTFSAGAPLRLTYRILGPSGDALLVEPVKVEP